tara:strand:+ start:13322 stop:14941 length:1620 start_codon:yes stop_codon:yes gene_type:complete
VKIRSSSFRNYPFTELFQDYTEWSESIQPFFEYNPFKLSEYVKRSQSLRFDTNKRDLVSALTDYNLKFGAEEFTLENIKLLEEDDVFTVVTGQQVTLFGGPLFTVYKIITAIITADKLTSELNKKVIPVFWVADEDHDFDEVSSISVPDGDSLSEFTFIDDNSIEKRAVEKTLSAGLNEIKRKIREILPGTDFSEDLWELLDHCYSEKETFGSSFGKLILQLFGKYGLILAGSNHDGLKKLIIKPLVKSVQDSEKHHQTLNQSSEELAKNNYHKQVTIQSSNLFHIREDASRIKLQKKGTQWYIDDSQKSWSSEELAREIESAPENFSPNVFLRPIIQNHILPVISYVAGPGEIAYYAQMRAYYEQFDITMPVITPRYSVTLIESAIDRIIGKLPFNIHDYFNRIEDLEKDFLKQSDSPDLETIFKNWKSSVSDLSKDPITRVAQIDPTLKKSADKTVTQFFTELDKLKGKLYRSVKDSEQVQIQRIHRVQNSLYPNRNLQEREVAFISLMNKYGIDIWDKLIEELKSEETNTHKLTYL